MTDLFKQLDSFQWRGIEFPCESFEMDLTQDLVEHKWPDRDGAHVEAVGLNPRIFTAKILFLNSIKPGPKETKFAVLYPNQYRVFINACADRSLGVLQHPEFGLVNCKVRSIKTHWSATRRDGVIVDATWIESATDTLQTIASPSPIDSANFAALDLDAKLNTLPPDLAAKLALPKLPKFSNLVSQITAVADSVSLFQKQIAGKINSVTFALQQISAAVDRAKDPRTANIRQSIERLRDSMNKTKTRLLVEQQGISTFLVPKAMTLAQIAALLKVKIEDIMKLNIATLGSRTTAFIPAGTFIRFYPPNLTGQPGVQHG